MQRLLCISSSLVPSWWRARVRPASHRLYTHAQQLSKYSEQQHLRRGRIIRRHLHNESTPAAPSLAPSPSSLPLPTIPLYHLFPTPVSRVGYGGVTRPAVVNEDTVVEEVTGLLQHGVNVMEIGKTWTHLLSEAVKKQQNGSAPVIFTHSISWSKLCKWIIGRRKDLMEQKKAAAEQEQKRETRRQMRLKNAAAAGTAAPSEAEVESDSPPRIIPHVRATARTEKIVVRPTAGQSQDDIMQQTNTMVADTFQREADRRQQRSQQQHDPSPSSPSSAASTSASVPTTDNLSELLPTADLSLITDSTAAVDWNTIDLFPYLHAYLLDLCVVHELPYIDILILTDVDTPLIAAPSDDQTQGNTSSTSATATDAHTVWNAQPQDEFFQRWFIAFEQLVLAQRLRWYGVRSTRFALPPQHPHFLSLPTVIEVAQSIVDQPHFTVIRYPFNAFNTDIATVRNIVLPSSSSLSSPSASSSSAPSSSYMTTLEYARRCGLLTLSDTNTDAVDHNGFSRRLQSFPLSDSGRELVTQLTTLMNDARWLEFEYLRLIKEHSIPAAQLPDPLDVFWANSLAVQWEQWYNLPVFEQIRWEQINETLRATVMTIYRLPFPSMAEWAKQYRWSTSALFKCIFDCLEYEIAWQSKEMNDFLVSVCPALDVFPRLEHKYLLLYLCAEGSDVLLTDDVASVVTVLQIAGEMLVHQARVKSGAESPADVIDGFPSNLLGLPPASALKILHQCEQRFGAWEPHPMSEEEAEHLQAEKAATAQQSSDSNTTTSGTTARPMPEQPATTQKHLTGRPKSFFDIKRERITALQIIRT